MGQLALQLRDDAIRRITVERLIEVVTACALFESKTRPLRLWAPVDLADAVLVELQADVNLGDEVVLCVSADPEQTLRCYIQRTTRRVWRRFHREEKRQHRGPCEDKPGQDPQRTQAISAEQTLVQLAVAAIVEDLPKRDQLILQLRYTDDLTLAEIGAKLGITKAASSKRLERVKAKVKKLWQARVDRHETTPGEITVYGPQDAKSPHNPSTHVSYIYRTRERGAERIAATGTAERRQQTFL